MTDKTKVILCTAVLAAVTMHPMACRQFDPVQTDIVYAAALKESAETETESSMETETESERETETETESGSLTYGPPLVWLTFSDADGHSLTADADGLLPAWNGQADRRPVLMTVHVADEGDDLQGAWGICSLTVFQDGEEAFELQEGADDPAAWQAAAEDERTWTCWLPADHVYQIFFDYENTAGLHPEQMVDRKLVIDRTPPRLQIGLKEDERLLGRGSRMSCSLKITDAPGPEPAYLTDIQLLAAAEEDGQPDILLYENALAPLTDGSFEQDVTIDADSLSDGSWRLKLSASDMMGYRSEVFSDPFEIDTRPPECSLRITGGLDAGSRFGKGPVTVRVTCKDAHPDAGRVPMIHAQDMPFSFSGWQMVPGGLEGEIRLTEEGRCRLALQAADAAGNLSDLQALDPFVIDRTPPLIEVSGGWQTYCRQLPGELPLSITDSNLLKEAVRAWTQREDNGAISSYGPGLSDGWYILNAAAWDAAGNRTDFARAFVLDRAGSGYKAAPADKDLLEGGIMAAPRQVSVIETNLAPVKDPVVRLSHAGLIRELVPDRDYSIREEGGEPGTRTMTYTLKAGCFAGEGLYMLHFSSRDAAGNENISQQKGAYFAFVADYTPPSLHGVNIADGALYPEESHTFTVFTGSPDTVRLRYYLDEVLAGTFDEAALAQNHGVFVFTMHADGEDHRLRFEAEDRAGHKAGALVYEIHVGDDGAEMARDDLPDEAVQENLLQAAGYEDQADGSPADSPVKTAEQIRPETGTRPPSENASDAGGEAGHEGLPLPLALCLIFSILMVLIPLIIAGKRSSCIR